MTNRVALNDHLREIRLFRGRVIVAVGFFALLIVALIARLYWLQVAQHTHFRTLSEDNRVKIYPVPPTRGLIFDRNGTVLAGNLPSYALEITREQVDDLDATLAALAEVVAISDADLRRFQRLRWRKRAFEGTPLRLRLSEEEVARMAVNRHRFPGVEITAGLTRHYPQGGPVAHVVGYVGRINERELERIDEANYAGTNYIGKIGVELTYEDVLHGSVGYRRAEVNALGRVVRDLDVTPPSPGLNLYLTLDHRLQHAAELALDGRTGAVVAIDPNNGEVLAMVSNPGFDPNLFVNGISGKAYSELRDDPDRPLFNRVLRGQYPPGSTVKPFYALAGMEYGAVSADHRVFCPGYYTLPTDKEHRYRDWKKTGHGWTDMNKSVVQSCDVYYYELAVKLGIDRLKEFMDRFGFGRLTEVDIDGELGGLMPSQEWKRRAKGQAWYPGETVITGIGQGFTLVTPLQLAAATATLANRGVGWKPHVVSAEENPITGEVVVIDPQGLPPVPRVAERNWDLALKAMHDVVNTPSGTARRISEGAPFKIAGKTGTAQVFTVGQEEEYKEDEVHHKLRDHALFMAYAPFDDPQIAVAVVVENGGHGGSAAAPVARAVFDAFAASQVAPQPVKTGDTAQ